MSEETATSYTGSAVLDDRGETIGTITDVIYEGDAQETPSWIVVDPGILRAEHYVPFNGAYRSDDDDVVIPFDRETVRSAPKASGDHVLTDDDRSRLAEHYRLPHLSS